MAQPMNFPILNPYDAGLSAYTTVSGEQRAQKQAKLDREMQQKQISSFEEQLASELAMQQAQRQQMQAQSGLYGAQTEAAQGMMPYEQERAMYESMLKQQEFERQQQLISMGGLDPTTQKLAALQAMQRGGMPGQPGQPQQGGMPPPGAQQMRRDPTAPPGMGGSPMPQQGRMMPQQQYMQQGQMPQQGGMPQQQQQPPYRGYEPGQGFFPSEVADDQLDRLMAYEYLTPEQKKAAEQGASESAKINAQQMGQLKSDAQGILKETPRQLKAIKGAKAAHAALPSLLKGKYGGVASHYTPNKKDRENIDLFKKEIAQLSNTMLKGFNTGNITKSDYDMVENILAGKLTFNENAVQKVLEFSESDAIREAEKAELIDWAEKMNFSPTQIGLMFLEYQQAMPAYSKESGKVDRKNLGRWSEYFGADVKSQFRDKDFEGIAGSDPFERG